MRDGLGLNLSLRHSGRRHGRELGRRRRPGHGLEEHPALLRVAAVVVEHQHVLRRVVVDLVVDEEIDGLAVHLQHTQWRPGGELPRLLRQRQGSCGRAAQSLGSSHATQLEPRAMAKGKGLVALQCCALRAPHELWLRLAAPVGVRLDDDADLPADHRPVSR